MVNLRPMTAADVEDGMRLKAAAGWNQIVADWRRFLAHGGDGCFVAVWQGQVVGSVTKCQFDSIGWVTTLHVEEAHRGAGDRQRLAESRPGISGRQRGEVGPPGSFGDAILNFSTSRVAMCSASLTSWGRAHEGRRPVGEEAAKERVAAQVWTRPRDACQCRRDQTDVTSATSCLGIAQIDEKRSSLFDMTFAASVPKTGVEPARAVKPTRT